MFSWILVLRQLGWLLRSVSSSQPTPVRIPSDASSGLVAAAWHLLVRARK